MPELESFQVSATECWTGATPVPESETVVGDPVALLTIEMLLLALPAVVALNWTERVSFCEGARVTGVLPPLTEYSDPLTDICEIATLELPVLVTVTVWEAEEVPVVTLPKFKLVGLMLRV